MANSELKLHYFNGKGRGETARLLFVASGKKYADVRYEEADWSKHKHIAPFGQLPLLEVDGKFYAQSLAIKNYLARELGFYGQTNLECLSIDQITQLIEDLTNVCVKALFTGDEAQIKKAVEKVKTEECPKFLGFFEKLLKDNGTGYFVGNRLTLADIAVFDVATGMLENCVDINDSFPNLKKNVQLVRSHSKIGPYLASRPVTPF